MPGVPADFCWPVPVHRLAECRGHRGKLVWEGQAGADHGHMECSHLCGEHAGDRHSSSLPFPGER